MIRPAPPLHAAVSVDPATGREIARYPFLDAGAVSDAVAAAQAGQQVWRATAIADRTAVLERMAAGLRREREQLAHTITTEMGKPSRQSSSEIDKSAATLEWYAAHGPAMLVDQPTTAGPGVRVVHRPLGVVLSVQPWNFPVWQVIRSAVGILLGGNAYLLKPAPTTVGCALALADLWTEAGLPPGAFTVLNVHHEQVADVIGHPAVAAVTVTGSVGAGAAVAASAGAAVKKAVLELGGSDPFIVLKDADLDAAADAAVASRFQNTGQVCLAAKRLIVEDAVASEFTDRIVSRVARLVVGDPQAENSDIGPLARADLREEIHRQVTASVGQGGRLLTGGAPVDGPGYFYRPTVIDEVRPSMVAFREELFGPVAVIVRAEDAAEALTLGNDSPFGLSASVWTNDPASAARLAEDLEVGGVFVNRVPASDPRIPIGGVKQSGFGRELSSYGVHEFMNIKTVWQE
jgi:succinate-semialdehyde dehydrogenase